MTALTALPTLPTLRARMAIGAHGLSVSPICVGMVNEPATIGAAFAAGINFFFVSADLHWPRYQATRRGLADLFASNPSARDEVVVAAPSYVAQPEFARAPFEELLAELPGLERIDVLVIGGVYGVDFERRLDVFRQLAADSFCGAGALGASFHDRACARAAIEAAAVDLAFLRYNPRHPGAQFDVFPRLPAKRATRVFGFKSTVGFRSPARLDALGLEPDIERPPITDYYRFALGPSAVDGILCSPTVPEHVDELRAALERGPLPQAEADHMIALADFARDR